MSAELTPEQRKKLFQIAARDKVLAAEMSPAQRLAFKARGNRKLAELGFDRQTRAMRSAVLKAKR